MKLPKHVALCIEHNEHEVYHLSVREYLDQEAPGEPSEIVEACVDAGEVWAVHWYPTTPLGFLRVHAPTLEQALSLALEVGEDYERDSSSSDR